MASNTYLGGGLNVAGSTVPAAVVNDVLDRMRNGNFTMRELQQAALDALRTHKGPVTTYMTVAERLVERHRRSGQIARIELGRSPVWAWTAPQ